MSDEREPSLPFTITIGEQTLRIRVRPEDQERVNRAQRLANRVLGAVQSGGVVGGLRAFAMTAFQLALELEEAREAQACTEQSRDRIDELIRRIDRATESSSTTDRQTS